MTTLVKSKINAFLVHISICAFVLLNFLSIVWFVWYPNAFFEIEGGWPVIVVLMSVDVIVGPLLTFVVFNPEKKSLYFDLSVIAILQIAAFAYGSTVIYQQRPAYVAFYENHYALIPAASVNSDELEDKSLANSPFGKPRFVYVKQPVTSKERKEVLASLAKGIDITQLPKFYRSYEKNWQFILTTLFRLDVNFILKQHPEQKAVITEMAHGLPIETLVYYPLQGSAKRQVIVLHPKDGSLLGTLDVDPGSYN